MKVKNSDFFQMTFGILNLKRSFSKFMGFKFSN